MSDAVASACSCSSSSSMLPAINATPTPTASTVAAATVGISTPSTESLVARVAHLEQENRALRHIYETLCARDAGELFSRQPEDVQLGFLSVLKSSPAHRRELEYVVTWTKHARVFREALEPFLSCHGNGNGGGGNWQCLLEDANPLRLKELDTILLSALTVSVQNVQKLEHIDFDDALCWIEELDSFSNMYMDDGASNMNGRKSDDAGPDDSDDSDDDEKGEEEQEQERVGVAWREIWEPFVAATVDTAAYLRHRFAKEIEDDQVERDTRDRDNARTVIELAERKAVEDAAEDLLREECARAEMAELLETTTVSNAYFHAIKARRNLGKPGELGRLAQQVLELTAKFGC